MAERTQDNELYDNHGEIDLAGSSNAYTATTARAITGYYKGLRICGKANHSNSGASTLNVNGLGAVAIRRNVSVALIGGEIISGQYYDFVYDFTNGWFQLMAPSPDGLFQPLDSDLTAIAALTTTTFGRSLLTLANAAAGLTTLTAAGQGKQTIWVPAGSWRRYPSAGANPPLNINEFSALNNAYEGYDFDATSGEFVFANILMPKSWDEGQVSFKFVWSHAATVTNFGVTMQLAAHAISDDDTLNITLTNAANASDTGGTTNDQYTSPESSAFTIGGSPAEGDLVHFRLGRIVADAGDTLAVDARVIGVHLFYTTNAATDA